VVPCQELRDRRVISGQAGPLIPDFRFVVDQIDRIIAKEKSRTPHPFGYPLIFRREWKHKLCFSAGTVDLIEAAIREPLAQLFSDFVYCFCDEYVRASEWVRCHHFNSDLFLAQRRPEDRQFYTQLLESQNFEMYIEDRIEEYLAANAVSGVVGSIRPPTSSPERWEMRTRTKSIDQTLLEAIGRGDGETANSHSNSLQHDLISHRDCK
jgi:hypothetical protein